MSSKHLDQAKDTVYDYIGGLARHVPAQPALDAFYDLLYRRVAVGRPDVVASLDDVIRSEGFKQDEGLRFLNRSFYTICNPWHLDGEMTPYLERLVAQLNDLPDPAAQDPLTRLLRRRLQAFNQGDYGDCLHRQMRLGAYGQRRAKPRGDRGTLADYLADYFYLYCSTTRTPDIEALEQGVYDDPRQSGLGYKQVAKLEDMFRAVGEYRRLRLQGADNLVNPTRLPLAEFEQGLIEYHPRQRRGGAAPALALDDQIQPTVRYSHCRPLIQTFLRALIDPLPQQTRDKLHRDLFRAMGTIDEQAVMAVSTVINLFTRLLDAVFLPDFNTSNVLRFQQYIDKSGAMAITKVLLHLLLACPMVRFDLEKKLGYLYRHFETSRIQTVAWVVHFFDHVNLALVMNARRIGYFSVVAPPPHFDSL